MIPQRRKRELEVLSKVRTTKGPILVNTIIDSGCTTSSISQKLVDKERIPTWKLERSIQVLNTDSSPNTGGRITEKVTVNMNINGHSEQIEASVVHLQDRADIFLGHDWLVKHNPEVDWNNGKIKFTQCPKDCQIDHQDIDISHKLRSIKIDEDLWEEEDKPDPTKPDDLPDYI